MKQTQNQGTEKIQLFVRNGQWHAQSSSSEVKRLFGTDTIPTAYSSNMPAAEVVRNVKSRNPAAIVTAQA